MNLVLSFYNTRYYKTIYCDTVSVTSVLLLKVLLYNPNLKFLSRISLNKQTEILLPIKQNLIFGN